MNKKMNKGLTALKKVKDKTRKKQKNKKDADKRIKDYKKGKQTFRGQGGR